MQKRKFLKSLSLIVCIVLIAAMALFTTGCQGNTDGQSSTGSADSSSQTTPETLGEGKTEFNFTVTKSDGKELSYVIHTDKVTVGEALLELKLIAGDESTYGLYVKTVDGETLDYEKDGKYWAFYVDGAYAASGVDSTKITAGATYSFKAE